jgi:YidC/Oxa1 family membrane protein insertase
MDKRTFLFMILLSLTLFGVNLFFQQQNSQKKKEWLEHQKQKDIQKQKRLEEDIVQRTASFSSLPIASAYEDVDQQHFLTAGVLLHNQLLTLSWTEHVPQKVFIQTTESEQPKEFQLVYQQPGLGSVVIYQAQNSELIPTTSLPEFGRYDLQLISFHPLDNQHPLGISLGQYTDGHFSLPRNGLTETKTADGKILRYLAIALLKIKDNYVPVGFYDPHKKQLIPFTDLEALAQFSAPLSQEQSHTANLAHKSEEKFYVLENEYQQLVFSNYGGALAEINLPFKTKENPSSVVREIEFDRQMIKQHPYNALFPAHAYYTPSENASNFNFHEKGQLGGYYPLIRRDLIQTGKRPSIHIKPQYYALNIISEYPELAELVYEVKEFTPNSIMFEATQNQRRITKTYSFGKVDQASPYIVNLDIKVEGDSRGLWLTSGVPEVEWISGGPASTLKYRITRNQKAEVNAIDLPKDAVTVTSVYPDWICNSNGFLGTILDPLMEIDPGYRVQYISGTTVPSRLVEIDQDYERYKAANLPGYMTLLPLKSQGGKMSFRLFSGPFDTNILKQVDELYSDPATGYNPDYIACQTMHGWFTFISEPFAKFLFILMNFFHFVTGSWALSIILLTICLRIILYPLNAWSTKSMLRMQQIGPEVTALQEKHKKDPKKAQIEIMNLYRERGINPMSGCLPLLIQMPFLIGMFDLLKSSFALRGAPFIPGWIDDLTAPDVLFSWSYPVFFFGTEFHLLPILLGLVMFIQQRYFSSAPQDPSLMTDQQRQQRAMGNMMTIVFAVMFYNFPSGLNIYWLSSMLLGMLQQWYTNKKMKAQPVVATSSAKVKTKTRKSTR